MAHAHGSSSQAEDVAEFPASGEDVDALLLSDRDDAEKRRILERWRSAIRERTGEAPPSGGHTPDLGDALDAVIAGLENLPAKR